MQDFFEWKAEHKDTPEYLYWDALKAEHERLHKSKNRKVRATLSNAPCTEDCWHAKGNVCACSCGGKNHGIGHEPKPKEATL